MRFPWGLKGSTGKQVCLFLGDLNPGGLFCIWPCLQILLRIIWAPNLPNLDSESAGASVGEGVGSQGPSFNLRGTARNSRRACGWTCFHPSGLGIQKKIKFDLEKLKTCDFLVSYLGSKAHTFNKRNKTNCGSNRIFEATFKIQKSRGY